MIGSRVGSQGAQYSSAVGSGSDDEGSGGIPGVSRDGTSRIYVPASLTEWTTFMSAIGLSTGNPTNIWLCQDSAGNLADATGALTLTKQGVGQLYQQPVAGWSRGAVVTQEAGAQRWDAAAGGPDIATTSGLLIAYVQTVGGATIRSIMAQGAATKNTAQLNTISTPRATSGANVASGASSVAGQVRPWVLRFNRTATTSLLATDQEKVVPVFDAACTGQGIYVGNVPQNAAATSYLYVVAFQGAAAELSDAQLKTLLQGLGWTIPWS